MPQALTLIDSVVHLDGDGAMAIAPNTPAFWERHDRPELSTGHVLTMFRYRAPWDYGERHPTGDELVVALEGTVELLLDTGQGEHRVELGRGEAVVVPAGAWHRLGACTPCTLLFLTPVPARTEHRGVEPAPT